MSELPKVVVITRTRNRTQLLKRAIQSVLAQSMPDWLHVIVNDGGKKEDLETLTQSFEKEYKGRLLVLHEKHGGMQNASNAGIRKSDSTYLTIHDDDDSWHPDFLKETTAYLDEAGPESRYQGAISKTFRILEAENEDGSFTEIERKPYIPLKEISLFRIGFENPFAPIAFVYRRSAHEKIGLFDPQWDMVADLDFNFRFLQNFDIGVVDKPLAYYHWRDNSSSANNLNSVTAHQVNHGQYLAELKNHYTRKAESARDAANALAFNVSSYAVENQWMTAEIRERVRGLAEQIMNLQTLAVEANAFTHASVWPKLEQDIIPQLKALHKLTTELHSFNHQAIWPKLEQDLLPKLETLLKSTNGLGVIDFEAIQQRLLDIKVSLEEAKVFNHDALWPKVEFLSRAADQSHRERAEAQKEHQASLQALIEAGQSHDEWLRAIREELAEMKTQSRKGWKLGRLRINWQANPEKKSSDDPSV